jgi:hypothetical protein
LPETPSSNVSRTDGVKEEMLLLPFGDVAKRDGVKEEMLLLPFGALRDE